MFSGKIDDAGILNDPWVKKFVQTFDAATLASLIAERLTSASVGPYVSIHSDEQRSDIIDAFIASGNSLFRTKLEPAVANILYKALNNPSQGYQTDCVLTGIFSIIKNSKLVACRKLMMDWLAKQVSLLTSTYNSEKRLYYQAMFAYANIQEKRAALVEDWWLNIWKEGDSYFWSAAFYGLRHQNYETALKQIPLLIERRTKMEKAPAHLYHMWADDKDWFEHEIRTELEKETGYAGMAINILIQRTNEEERRELFGRLKEKQ